MNEGQRKRTGSLSLQVKSRASTVRAASSRTSSRHMYISYIEFIVLIHIFNSYTKFIVLIHIISSLQASSTCLSMSTRISWHIGRQRYCKADPANAIAERYLRKTTALWPVFLHRSNHGAASSGRKKIDLWNVKRNLNHSESILTQTAVQRQFAAPSAAQRQQTHCNHTLFSFAIVFGQILTSRQDLAKVL